LPDAAKLAIAQHLAAANIPVQYRVEFDRICDFMNRGASTDGFVLRMKIQDLDRKRQQNLCQVEPEFASIIEYAPQA
jgi:hypothetical protein